MLDAGEGASSNLPPPTSGCFLSTVFVGHRHHDHAGGLTGVVDKVKKEEGRRKERLGTCEECGRTVMLCHPSGGNKLKRKVGGGWCECREAVVVIADDTVMYDLNLQAGCEGGVCRDTGRRVFHAVRLEELDKGGRR